MPTAKLHPDRPGRILLETDYVDRFLVKQLPGANYDGETRTWHAPLAWSTCITMRGLFGDSLELADDLKDWAWAYRQRFVDPALALRELVELPAEVDPDLQMAYDIVVSWRSEERRLRPFQEVDVLMAYVFERGIVEQPMGAGKTVVGACFFRLMTAMDKDPYPALVVCPNSVKVNWERELIKWVPGVKVQVVQGSAGARRAQLAEPADIFVMNWEAIRNHSRLASYGSYALRENEKVEKELNFIPWRTVFGDELHRAKSPLAKQTRAFWYIGKDATYRIGFTGTPIANNHSELWSLLHGVDPVAWPSKTKYVDRWLVSSFNIFGGMEIEGLDPANKAEFFAIIDPMTRRLPKEVILPELPPKIPLVREAEMSPKQARAYKQMLDHMLAEVDNGDIITSPNPLARTGRLLQFASSYAQMDEHGKVILSEPSSKLDIMDEVLDELLDQEQVAVFAYSVQLINMASARLTKRGIEHGMITGDVNIYDRQEAMDDFQAGKKRVMLATVGAGGTGITLTAASTMLRLQRSWKMIDNQQAEDRVHRIGSEVHEHIKIIDVIAPGTYEEKQQLVLEGKIDNLQEILRDKELMKKFLKEMW